MIISRFQETGFETCKFRDHFSEILREMQKRKLLEKTVIKRNLLNSFFNLYSKQISTPALQNVRLKQRSS